MLPRPPSPVAQRRREQARDGGLGTRRPGGRDAARRPACARSSARREEGPSFVRPPNSAPIERRGSRRERGKRGPICARAQMINAAPIATDVRTSCTQARCQRCGCMIISRRRPQGERGPICALIDVRTSNTQALARYQRCGHVIMSLRLHWQLRSIDIDRYDKQNYSSLVCGGKDTRYLRFIPNCSH